MAKIVVDGDITSGHSGFPAVPIHASTNVTLNGIKVAVHGDACDQHCNVSCHVPHGIASCGVTINGIKVLLDGDATDCGDTLNGTGGGDIS